MLKVRQALKAAGVLAVDPFDFQALNKMVDACSLAWPVQAWYRVLLRRVPRERLEHLRVLTQRPLDYDELEALPEGTFGKRYASFCREHRIVMGGHALSAPELHETFAADWVTHRFFKIHDILHCIVGFGTTVAAELGLQMFDFLNLREPYGLLAIASSPYMVLHYGAPRDTVREIVRGAALAQKSGNLFFAPFEEMWTMDYDDARRLLGFS
jgi:ubiquinone biosynthesis protein Coq4